MAITIGQRLGSYEIGVLLGKGGMGEVYRAKDTRLHRTVAIKVLSSRNAVDDESKRRFMQEARAASALNHPNIVTVHDIASDGGSDYLVMEYVPGNSLEKLITPKGFPLPEAINYVIQIANALAAAHAAGIVHRDIKPANVIVSPESQVKVLDFGLAKLTDRSETLSSIADGDAPTRESALTEIGTVMGTVAYMSPEQASGRLVDHRTDIFSLGVILYEVLTGQRPFRGRSQVDVMHAIINDPAPPLLNQPSELNEILDKALAKDPKDRYQHAGDLALDLRRFLSRPVTAGKQPKAKAQLMRWAAVAVIIALIAGATWMWQTPPAVADNLLANAPFRRLTDFAGSESEAAISRDGRFVVFRSDRDGPVDTWVSQVDTGRFVNLTKGARPSVLVRNAGFTADASEIWLSAIRGGDRMRLLPLMGGTLRPFLLEHAMEPAWSPDGSKIVFHVYEDGDPTFVADANGGNPQQIFTLVAGGHNHYFVWSRDGQWIFFVSGLWDAREMDIWRIRPSGGKPERLTSIASDIRYLAPIDNRTLLYVSPDQNGAGPWLWALDIERKQSRRISSGLEVYSSVDVSADGRRLAVTVSNPTANLWSVPILDRVAEEKDVKAISLPTVRAYAPRYGGTSLFYLSSRGGGDGLWRYENNEATEIWKGSDGALFEPAAVSSDGRRLAVILRKQGKRTLHTLSADGADVRPLAPMIDVTSGPNWSPDGKWIVVAGIDSTEPGLFKIPIDTGLPQRLLKGTVSNPVWSPDGTIIVYTGPIVSEVGPLLMIHADGSPVEGPSIKVRVGTEHYRFVPGKLQLVYIPEISQVVPENFWLLDLDTKRPRQLSNFDSRLTRTFDVTTDNQIVFDRLRENSDIAIIDLPEKNR